jgi:DNA excision repair protein ERCC-6
MLVEREASRVAKEAADVLRESRRQARRNDIGTPTWTGRFGAQPARFGSPNRTNGVSGLGSESLLARMRHRQALEGTSSSSPPPPPVQSGPSTPTSHVLIGQIRDFMMGNGGSASSRELVAQFSDVRGPEAIAEFRKMVKQIAEFQDSVWTVKEEYT